MLKLIYSYDILLVLFLVSSLAFSGCAGGGSASSTKNSGSASVSSTSNSKQSAAPQNENVKNIQVGDIAPDFTLKDLEGNQITLSALRGKKVLVNMWSFRCKGCVGEMVYFQEIHQKWSAKGLIVIAISTLDSREVIRAYAEGKKLTYTMIVDEGKQINQSYVICGVPTTFIIDEKGVVRAIKDGAFTSADEIEDLLRFLE